MLAMAYAFNDGGDRGRGWPDSWRCCSKKLGGRALDTKIADKGL